MKIIENNIWLKNCLIYSKSPNLPIKSLKNTIQIKTWIKISNKYLFPGQAYQVPIQVCVLVTAFKVQMLQLHPSLHFKNQTCSVYAKQICNTTYTINGKLKKKKSTPHQCHSSTMLYQLQANFRFSFQTCRRNTNIWTLHILLRTNSN